jgi:hypothetical protein
VDAWKRARAQAAVRRGEGAAEMKAAATTKFEASAEGGPALDVSAEAGVGPAARPSQPAPSQPSAPLAGAADEGEYTSRLLKAKQRARPQDDEEKRGG